MVDDSIIQSVDRALHILDMVSRKREGCGVTELSIALPLNKTSVFRMLSTLKRHGLVEQDPETERYKIGYKVLELSGRLLDSIDLRAEARPYLRELENLTNEVIHLVIYNRGEVVYIEKLEGNETLRMHSKVGNRAPMHCTGVGKVILAHLPREEAQEVIDQCELTRHTGNTITDKDALCAHLRRVRQQGYALDLEENEAGINCIAAPIFDHAGRVVSALSVSGPAIRMTEERIETLKGKVMETSRKISRRLGYTAP